MDRNLKLSVIDSMRIAKLQALQDRLRALNSLREVSEMKTVQKLHMLRMQGKPEHVQAAHVLSQEVAKRAAELKLAALKDKLGSVISRGDSCARD